jgi:hypothetical protein
MSLQSQNKWNDQMFNSKVSSKKLIAIFTVAVCLPLSTANAEPVPVFQTAEVHTFPGAPTDTTSGGTLLRTKNSVTTRLALHGFDADSVYSIWWVIFNDPDSCAGGPGDCNGGDFGPADASILNAAGFVTSASGSANITAELEARVPAAGLQVEFGNGIRPGNGFGAEVHMLFLSHGPVAGLVGTVSEHISFTAGGAAQYGIGFPPAN